MRAGADRDPVTGADLPDVPTLDQVERTIAYLDDRIEETIGDYAVLAEAEAAARADWEEHRDRTILAVARMGGKTSEDVRLAEAKAAISFTGVPGEELYRAYRIVSAALDACGKALGALQSRLSVQQSMLRHLRQVTGLDGPI